MESQSEAQSFLDAGQVEKALDLSLGILATNSSDKSSLLIAGIALYQLDRPFGAIEKLEKLDRLLSASPSDSSDNGSREIARKLYLNLGHSYSKVGESPRAKDAYLRYVELEPNAESKEKYRTLISVLPSTSASEISSSSGAQTPRDYLAAVVKDSGIYRWSEKSMPLRVFIGSGASVPGYRDDFDEALRHAFWEWTGKSGGNISFETVPEKSKANFIVEWSDNLHAPELKAEAGNTRVTQDSDGINSAVMTILTVSPFKDGPVDKQVMYNVCLHEIGHALGIMGHSPYEEDVMYPQLNVQKGLSLRDVNTLLALYDRSKVEKLKADMTSQMMQALDRATAPGSAGSERDFRMLLEMGTNACFAGNYKDAIKPLEAYLKFRSSDATARHNLSAALNSLAVDSDDPRERMQYIHSALFWEPENKTVSDNLRISLQELGYDPDKVEDRIRLANECEKKGDIKAAFVELEAAVRLKADPAIERRKNELKTKALELSH